MITFDPSEFNLRRQFKNLHYTYYLSSHKIINNHLNSKSVVLKKKCFMTLVRDCKADFFQGGGY